MIKNDLYKTDPFLINIDPAGNNRLSTRALYYQRKIYDIKFVREQPNIVGNSKDTYAINYEDKYYGNFIGNEYALDLRDTDMYYGRLDIFGNEINLNENNLIGISGAPDVKILNFVADAFYGFKYDLENIVRDRKYTNESYKELKPKVGYTSFLEQHHNFMKQLYKTFYKFMEAEHKQRTMQNFKDFLEIFIRFIDASTPITPFTRSEYLKNKEVSCNINGLILEFEKKPLDSDKFKYEEYLKKYDYNIFRETAIKYGFYVDKHVPWRIIFNINSPEAKKYISAYGLQPENIFDTYYTKTRNYDIDTLKIYLIGFYNSYIENNPNYVSTDIVKYGEQINLKTTIKKRNPETLETIGLQFQNFFWVKLYAFIKLRENNVDLNQDEYNLFIKTLYNNNKYFGSSAVYNQIKTISKNIDSFKKNRNFHFLF